MRVRAISGPPASVEADVLAVPIYREDAEMPADLAELDAASGGAIRRAIEWGDFNPIEHASALVDAGELPAGRLLLLNAGTRGRGSFRARRLASVATRQLNGRGAETPGALAARRRGRRRVGRRRRPARWRAPTGRRPSTAGCATPTP